MNLILYIAFLITVTFVFLPKIDAANVIRCEYRHPEYTDCRMILQKERNTSNWDFGDTQASQTNCATVDGKRIESFIILGEEYDNFFSRFENRYRSNGNDCPNLYIGSKVWACSLGVPYIPSSQYNINGIPVGTPNDCFALFNSRDGYESRIRVSGEKSELTESEAEKEDSKDEANGGKASIEELKPIGITDDIDSCEQLIGDETLEIINMVFLIIRIAAPIILIVLSMLDFSKAIASSDESALSKATSTFVKRMIATVLIFLTPTLINFLMDITGISDGNCGIDW